AKATLRGEPLFAINKRKLRGTPEMFPMVTARGLPGEEPVRADKPTAVQAGAGVPEEAVGTAFPKPTAVSLETEAQTHLQVARPNFEDFTSEARKKYGPNAPQAGQMRDLWQDQVWKRLLAASGKELEALREQLKLGRQL